MAYKVGTTIVIDDTGFVDWARIANKPAIGAGTVTDVTVVNGTPTAGINTGDRGVVSNLSANCYVESLSGGGAGASLTITANRKTFNCNCACRC